MATLTATSRRTCALAELLPDECGDTLHRHHVMPISAGGDPDGPTVWVCERHHPRLEHLARRVLRWKRCTHYHPYPGGRDACERRLNGLA
jgi:hypothetical protein